VPVVVLLDRVSDRVALVQEEVGETHEGEGVEMRGGKTPKPGIFFNAGLLDV
jgi:hypothetical protein